MVSPDSITFYLTTAGEYRFLSLPRECHYLSRLRDENRDDYMLVEISPPLIGQPFGLGDRDIDRLLLSTRHRGRTLFPIDEWPAHVCVTRITDDSVLESGSFNPDQVQLIAWGTLHRTYAQAEDEAKRWQQELL